MSGILDLLLGSDPGILGRLLGNIGGGTQQPGAAQPSTMGAPGGIPTTPGSSIPYGQSQSGLLGNGLLGNAARGALYGLGAAGQPGPKGFFAGVGRGAQQSIGMGMERGQYAQRQALGQQEIQRGQMQNQMLGARYNMFNQALAGQLPGQQGASGGEGGPDAQGQAGGGANMAEYNHYKALAQQTYQYANLGVPGYSNELAKHYDDLAAQSLGYKTAAAQAEAQGKPIELSRPGATLRGYNPQTGQYDVLAENPVLMPGRDAQGNPTQTPTFLPTGRPAGQGPQLGSSSDEVPQGGATNGVRDINSILDAQAGLPPGSMAAIDAAETAGAKDSGPGSVSTAGAAGRYQVMPNTVPAGTDLSNPLVAGPIAAKRLAEYQKKYARWGKNDPEMPLWLGAAAYNWGPANVDKWLMNGAKPDQIPPGVLKYANGYAGAIQQQQAPQPGGQAPAATGQPGNGAFTTGLGPQQTEEFTGQGKRFNAERDSAQAAAETAQKHSQILDQMRLTADEFRMGAGSHAVASAQAWGQYFGLTSDEANRQLGAYQDMRKLGITAGAGAIKDVSSKEALQGQKMIWEAQPNPGMSPDGFRRVVDSLQGADAAVIAKHQWISTQPLGTNIEAAWLKNTNAQAANVFWLQRVAETDPQLAVQIRDKLGADPAGQALLQKIITAKQWMQGQGLL